MGLQIRMSKSNTKNDLRYTLENIKDRLLICLQKNHLQ